MNFYLSVIASISIIFQVMHCHEIPSSFCEHNYFDAVFWDGSHFYFERIINRSVAHSWYADWDEKTQTLKGWGFKIETQKNVGLCLQSGFVIPTHPECDSIANNCTEMNKLGNLRFLFYYDTKGQQIISIDSMDKNNASKIIDIPYNLSDRGFISDNPFWPKGFNTKNMTYKPSVFWPKKYYFLYIISINTSDTFLATNSLLNKNWTHSWRYISLEEYKGIVFTSAFWWKKTNMIYVIGENQNNRREAFIYRFDENDLKKPFVSTGMKAIIFFGCKSKEPESKTTTNGLTLKSIIILIEIGVIVVLIFAIAFTSNSKKDSQKINK